MNHSDPDLPARASAERVHRVVVLVYDGVKLLDVAGPAEAFGEANRLGAHYRVELVSPTGEDVITSVGIRLTVTLAPDQVDATDTLVVAGGDVYPRSSVPPELTGAVRELAGRASRVASICTGAFILAAGGLLAGKRATTHWKVAPKLAQQYPDTQVEPDAIYVRDGSTYTSAGVSAGIDLALALVEADHGADLTRDVARALVVYLQRSGGQSQFSAPLTGSPPRTPALRTVVDRVTADPTGDHSPAELARHLNVSQRHRSRLFRDELGTTPARYVASIRFDLAKALLSQGHSATDAAARAGFPSYESLRKIFVRELHMPPAAYQHRFRSALRERPADRPEAVTLAQMAN